MTDSNIKGTSCNFCDQTFESSDEVNRHVKDDHQTNADVPETTEEPLEAINPNTRSIEEDNVDDLASGGQGLGGQEDNNIYQPPAVDQNYPVQSNSETDPFMNMISSLYFCPVCRKGAVDITYVQKHLTLFHKVPEEHLQNFQILLRNVALDNATLNVTWS